MRFVHTPSDASVREHIQPLRKSGFWTTFNATRGIHVFDHRWVGHGVRKIIEKATLRTDKNCRTGRWIGHDFQLVNTDRRMAWCPRFF